MRKHLDGSEQVLVVPARVLDDLAFYQGYRRLQGVEATGVVKTLLDGAHFVPRTEDLEYESAGLLLLQVVPYLIVVDRSDPARVFTYRRPDSGGDDRLFGRLSIGIGGHVNPCAGCNVTGALEAHWAVLQTLRREAKEEISILTRLLIPLGLLYDGRNDIGQRHIGMVYAERIEAASLGPNLMEVEPFAWLTPEAFSTYDDGEFESWSGLLLPHLGVIVNDCIQVFS